MARDDAFTYWPAYTLTASEAEPLIVTLKAVRYVDLFNWAIEDCRLRLRWPSLPGGVLEVARMVDLFVYYYQRVGIDFPCPSHLWFAAGVAINNEGQRRYFFHKRIKDYE